ncbi:bifunctional YncE family protein/alkaline phosphatase family protein [Humisphaera borealis]|uniref:Bifunctional YncE family protein/alkaline phosphatase family protein n=1 Tax=Humisphaera borealis TaxID=2807512 RepID=A0A7M2WY14_9BACT|nr:bifunctional YncE family protein/alkaline phosphatase family protein [Humisphaera borealis]QOV90244.1 bifunctional YncE family protein/alkaline phosphatase family protein [Humisphaera borealis]
MNCKHLALLVCLTCTAAAALAIQSPATRPAANSDERRVGPEDGDGGTIVTTGQLVRPAGKTLAYGGRPVDLCLSPDGKRLYVKNTGGLSVLDTATWAELSSSKYPAGSGSMHGVVAVATPAGDKLFVTGSGSAMHIATVAADGTVTWGASIDLPGPGPAAKPGYSHSLGLAVSRDLSTVYVCLSRNNTLGIVDLKAGKLVAQIDVGVCPYSVVLSADEATAYVSNFGGRCAVAGDTTAKSTGTDVVVDARTIATSGTVSRVDLKARKVTADIVVGLHPTQLKLSNDGKSLYLAAANSDEVQAIDLTAGKVAERIAVRPDANLPFGSLPNALALSPDGKTLYVANGGNNAVAVIELGKAGAAGKVAGFIPAGWFPGGVVTDGKSLYIANTKGEGSRTPDPRKPGWTSSQVRGSVSAVPLPSAEALAKMSAQVKADARVPEALRAMELAAASKDVPAKPVPAKVGEPSVFKHVVYVIKENRTYDQVFGAIGKGNSEPNLCIYGRDVTPNHHALAERFALLDNYYCNGVLSADGHQWATQGIVTDYQEKGFGGHTRSYDFGTDALTYANCNFIWDSVLLAGLSFRNYGEFDFPTLTGKAKDWYAVQKAWGTPDFSFKQSVEVEALRRFTCEAYPGWQMQIPDTRRMEVFLKEFAQFEKDGNFPSFVIVYLPQDHTQGSKATVPSPRAHVADNDLALGQMVQAISKSRFWKETCIFVNEDDPQNGFDHVDGHRSLCLVISPYTKRGEIVSKFYNQSSVLHTITRIFGLPPLNQLTAGAPTMEACFTDKPDFAPYTLVPNQIPIDEPNRRQAALSPREQKLQAEMDFSKPDIIEDDDLNELLWLAARPGQPYPKEWSGPHGKGLAALGLKKDPNAPKDEDD